MTRPDLASYAMILAEAAATRSEDPYRQVGTCVLRPDGTVAGLGYNGTPPGVEIPSWDRDDRRPWIIHAEVNALRHVRSGEVWLLASTSLPCQTCMLQIASYDIHNVIYRDELDPRLYPRDGIIKVAEASGIQVFKQGRSGWEGGLPKVRHPRVIVTSRAREME